MGRSTYNLEGPALDRAAAGRTIVPWVREIPADLITPVGAFMLLAGDSPRAFLLDSAEGGESVGRWSFLGWDPVSTVRAGRDWIERDGERTALEGSPLDPLREPLRRARVADAPDVPPFAGGWVGHLAYDAVRWFERLPLSDGVGEEVPRFEFSLYERVIALDHLKRRALYVTNLFPERGELAAQLRDARVRGDDLEDRLMHPRIRPGGPPPGAGPGVPVRSLTPRDAFLDGVRQLKEHITAGDIFQGVLSQRFVRPLSGSPFSVYRALRRINPSPYLFYLADPETTLAGSSPEMLVRCVDRELETHPIAGTRRRGADRAEDRRLAAELLADPKERAEHVMLVDLGRNDLGRVSASGSVEVSSFAEVEHFSHVMHLVSKVRGRLRPGLDALDALAAAFPAGTVTGAPKVRAMELLDELEPIRRGAYAGAVAYLDFDGNLDSCIAIRTLVARHGQAEVQAGAGIVADSVPESEYNETEAKAEAVMQAVSGAEETFG